MSAPSSIDPRLAAGLGFRKREYAAVERERRWLCGEVPDLIRQTLTVNDVYVRHPPEAARDASE